MPQLERKTLLENENGLTAVHHHQELGTWFNLYLHWLDTFDGANATYTVMTMSLLMLQLDLHGTIRIWF